MRTRYRLALTLSAFLTVASGCSEPMQSDLGGTSWRPATPGPPPEPAGKTGGYYLYLANASGVDLRQLGRGLDPVWSPDGSRIAFDRRRDDGTSSGIVIMDVIGTNKRQLTNGDAWSPRWSPDGSKIAFVTCIPNEENGPFPMCDMTFKVTNVDGSGERALARTNFNGTIAPPEWSADGKKIAFVSGEGSRADLYVINTDGSGLNQLTQLGTVRGADWSPDGRTIALGAAGSVYVINADGSDLTRLTGDSGALVVSSVLYSPVGDRIAFALTRDPLVSGTTDPGTLRIDVVNTDGTNRISVATHAWDPHWLPDNRTLSFSRWYVDEIWSVAADGGAPSRVLSDGFGAAWSPDGTLIAYMRQH